MNEFLNHLSHEFEVPFTNPVLTFSLILFIILLSPILLRKLNIPGIIGLIISGVIIGPHGLGILEKNSAVDLFSTIGLLYIMFIAGLELDMNDFRKNRHKSFLFGFFTFIIPLGLGFPVCYYLLGYGMEASFLTASMFATHTLVAYPIVSSMGVSKNQAVAITVGGTILTDTAVLIILAVVMGSAQGGLTTEFWLRLIISLAIFSAFMFLVIPRIAKWFFRKLESEKHSHYVFVLSVVFLAAFLAEVAGVEPIIGAFVAGLALNKLIPHSSPLMNRIEFIGNSIFIPFFLISVGMLVDVSVILNGPMALIVAATLTAVALAGKWLAAFSTRLVFRYTSHQQNVIFGLSSAHAAATLAVILVGYNAGILDENILNGTIILILVTCVVASFVTEKAARKVALSEEGMSLSNDDTVTNERILLPIANLGNMDKLLDLATLIKEKKSNKPITLLCVVPNDEEAESNIRKARKKLESIVNQAAASETNVEVIATIDHNVASGIARTSREIMSDLIIQGWPSKQGFLDKLLGERTQNILNSTDKTVMMCHLEVPLNVHKRLLVIVPDRAHEESGFGVWMAKVDQLARELSVPILHLCSPGMSTSIRAHSKKYQLTSPKEFLEVDVAENITGLTEIATLEDIIVLVSAREGSVSYRGALDKLPERLERHFGDYTRIVFFPRQFANEAPANPNYLSGPSFTLSKSMEMLSRLTKGTSGKPQTEG